MTGRIAIAALAALSLSATAVPSPAAASTAPIETPATSTTNERRSGATVVWFDDADEPVGVVVGVGLDPAAIDAERPEGGVRFNLRTRLMPAQTGRVAVTADAALRCRVGATTIDGGSATIDVVSGRAIALDCTGAPGAGFRWMSPSRSPLSAETAAFGFGAGGSGFPSLDAGSLDAGGVSALDTDGDGVRNAWETNGWTVRQSKNGVITIVGWKPGHEGATDPAGNRYVKYVSSPSKASTNNDPWTDFQKATTLELMPGTSKVAQHPLVAALPDVSVDLDKYRIIKLEDWSSSTGGSTVSGVTRTTSAREATSNDYRFQLKCRIFPVPWCSSQTDITKTTTVTATTRESTQNSSTEDWDSMLSGSTAKAAKVMPSVRYRNSGTAPIIDAQPTFTLANGDTTVATVRANAATKLVESLPGESYPATGSAALAFERANDFTDEITVDAKTFSQLKDPESDVTVMTNDVDAVVYFVDPQTGTGFFPSDVRWKDIASQVRTGGATITVERPDGATEKRHVAAPGQTGPDRTVPPITLGQALELTHGAVRTNDGWSIDGSPVTASNGWDITVDEPTGAKIEGQSPASLLDLQLEAGMRFTVAAPPRIQSVSDLDDGTSFTTTFRFDRSVNPTKFTGLGDVSQTPGRPRELVLERDRAQGHLRPERLELTLIRSHRVPVPIDPRLPAMVGSDRVWASLDASLSCDEWSGYFARWCTSVITVDRKLDADEVLAMTGPLGVRLESNRGAGGLIITTEIAAFSTGDVASVSIGDRIVDTFIVPTPRIADPPVPCALSCGE
jgi:hypothetical protein